ncbi:hypothetical protein ACOSQ3_005910 [Xanthoceras sorbifolium]
MHVIAIVSKTPENTYCIVHVNHDDDDLLHGIHTCEEINDKTGAGDFPIFLLKFPPGFLLSGRLKREWIDSNYFGFALDCVFVCICACLAEDTYILTYIFQNHICDL